MQQPLMNTLYQTMNGVEQPKLAIIEQPKMRGYRFRYQCEGDSHGGLQGKNSNQGHKSYPSVKLCNYTGAARITVSLITNDDVMPPKTHAHELISKHCKNGVYIAELSANDSREVQFPNLGIQHATRRNVITMLEKKLIEKIKFESMIKEDPINTGDLNWELTHEMKQQVRKQAEIQAKDIQLNVIRLCFQAYLMDHNGKFTHVLPPVCSDPIYDAKAPGASTLKICRMDKHAGCCMGGDEVFLLCDRVQKDDINIRFFEEGEDGMMKWQSFGQFGPSDVHRQFAIVFKTPQYWDTNIDRPVSVQVQLIRPNDNEASDPKPFTYYPQHLDQEEVGKKRKKKIFPPLDVGGSTFSGGEGLGSLGRKEFNLPNQSQFNVCKSSDNTGGRQQMMLNLNPISFGPFSNSVQTQPIQSGFFSNQPTQIMFLGRGQATVPAGVIARGQVTMPTGAKCATTPSGNDCDSDSHGCEDSSDRGCSVSDLVKVVLIPSGEDESDCVVEKVKAVSLSGTEEKHVTEEKVAPKREQKKKWQLAEDRLLAVDIAERTSLALQDYARTGDIMYILLIQRHLVAVQDENGDNALHQAIINKKTEAVQNFVRVIETIPAPYTLNQYNNMRQTPLHLAVLMDQPEMVELLLRGGTELRLPDRHGDTPVHIAARLGHVQCLEKMFPTVDRPMCELRHSQLFSYFEWRKPSPTTSLLNFDGYSPLHLAVQSGRLAVVKLLVAAKADVNQPDGRSGRVALHHAVEAANVGITGFLVLEANADLDAPTFDGSTPLHLAVGRDLVVIAAILMSAGADPNAENGDVMSEEAEDEGEQEIKEENKVENKVGNTAFDLAFGKDKMLQILNGEPYRNVVNPATSTHTPKSWTVSHDSGLGSDSIKGDVEKLGIMIRTQLGKLLDPISEGHDWKELAKKLGLETLITPISFSKAPTKALLDNYEGIDGTILQLRDTLVAMERADVVAVLDKELKSLQPKGVAPEQDNGCTQRPRSSTKEGVVTSSPVRHRFTASEKHDSTVDSGLDSMYVSSVNES